MADRRGNVAMLTGMAAASLMGFVGLGTDVTLWYVAKRDMQGATDAAAYSASVASAAGQTASNVTSVADVVAAKYGFTSSAVTVNDPPQSGSYTAAANAVEVIIQQPQTLIFSSLILKTSPTVSARAVAASEGGGSSGPADCLIALDKGKVTDIGDSGSGTLTLNSCSLAINSSATDALNLSGSAQIDAQSVSIVGGKTLSGSAEINAPGGVTTGATAATDPYSNLNIPSYGSCNQTSTVVSGVKTYSASGTTPYVFCKGLEIVNGNVTLSPGVYIINQGNLALSGTATLTGTNVTIILTSSSGSSYGTVSASGSSSITLTAPTTGATAGIALYGDRNAPTTGSNNFSGSGAINITGVAYFPSEAVTFSGTSGLSGASQCTQLIGYTITFSGSSTLNSNCKGTGVTGLGSASSAGPVQLVE
jgi:hypothetical protein